MRADWCRPPGCHRERPLQGPEYRPCLAGMNRMSGIRRMPMIISGSARPALRAGTGACCIKVRANGTSAEADRLRFPSSRRGEGGLRSSPHRNREAGRPKQRYYRRPRGPHLHSPKPRPHQRATSAGPTHGTICTTQHHIPPTHPPVPRSPYKTKANPTTNPVSRNRWGFGRGVRVGGELCRAGVEQPARMCGLA
jgi:hypothetical protein